MRPLDQAAAAVDDLHLVAGAVAHDADDVVEFVAVDGHLAVDGFVRRKKAPLAIN